MRWLMWVLLVLTLCGSTGTAWAHDVAEHAAAGVGTDERSQLLTLDAPAGISLTIEQNGLALWLANESPGPVVVDGVTLEPGRGYTWHLDAAHPSGDLGPSDPVRPWRVALTGTIDDAAWQGAAVGEVRWSPGPSPLPWIVGTLLVAAAVVAVGLRWRAIGPFVLVAAVGASVLHTLAAWVFRSAEGSRIGLLGGYLPQAGCWALAILAVVLINAGRRDGIGLGLLAAVGLLLLGVGQGAPVFSSSTVLTALPATVDRVVVVLALGLAAGWIAHALRAREWRMNP